MPTNQQIHIWCISLDRDENELKSWQTILPEEHQRAARFRFAADRRRWLSTHGAMRFILGAYHKVDPADVRLVYGPHGKPAIDPGFHEGALQFNLSRSGKLAVLAVTYGTAVGVDVELVREVSEALLIAECLFSTGEVAESTALPRTERSNAFLRCWTCKAAYLKALGSGLTIPVNRFRVAFLNHELRRILPFDGASATPSKWVLYPLTPRTGYVGAMAGEAVNEETIRRIVLMDVDRDTMQLQRLEW